MNQKTEMEGYRNFDLKPLTKEEERFIKNMIDVLLVLSRQPREESFQILEEGKEESFMEIRGKRVRNSVEIVKK